MIWAERTAKPGVVASPDDRSGWMAALLAFAGAVLGGLILNVMPCVFPILSLKALHLARGGSDERAARIDALGYMLGTVLMCVGLGALILALRAGGSAVGWAFQLQDPRIVVLLIALTFAITLNLAGRFEVPVPAFAQPWRGGGIDRDGCARRLRATPCSGPFMGAALGAALVLPWRRRLRCSRGWGWGWRCRSSPSASCPRCGGGCPSRAVDGALPSRARGADGADGARAAVGWRGGRRGRWGWRSRLATLVATGVILSLGGTRQRRGMASAGRWRWRRWWCRRGWRRR